MARDVGGSSNKVPLGTSVIGDQGLDTVVWCYDAGYEGACDGCERAAEGAMVVGVYK